MSQDHYSRRRRTDPQTGGPHRTRARSWLALFGGVLLAGCSGNQDPEGAALLWSRLQSEDYRTLPRAPGFETRTRSSGVHAVDVDLYVNETIQDALSAAQPLSEWPLGSLTVKDGWNGDELKIVAVMEKRSDGWFFAEYHADGSVIASGRPGQCAGCHRTGDDFVRSFSFPR